MEVAGEEGQVDRVVVEIEVAFFNIAGNRLVLGGLKSSRDGRKVLPHGWLRPDETPALGAERILREVTGITTGVHEPVFVGMFRYPQRGTDSLTLAFGVLGTRPNDSVEAWGGAAEASDSLRRMRDRVHSYEAAVGALWAVRTVISERPVAARLAPEVARNRDGLFRLKDLRFVYEKVLGRSIDVANFRRKVEATAGFLEVVDYDEVMETSKPPAVTRGRRPTWYRAGRAERLDPPIRFEPR